MARIMTLAEKKELGGLMQKVIDTCKKHDNACEYQMCDCPLYDQKWFMCVVERTPDSWDIDDIIKRLEGE